MKCRTQEKTSTCRCQSHTILIIVAVIAGFGTHLQVFSVAGCSNRSNNECKNLLPCRILLFVLNQEGVSLEMQVDFSN
jgi:hypothetical protein